MTLRDKKKRREKLWNKDPRCHWCGIETIRTWDYRKHKAQPLNLATIDHIRSRLNPDRGKPFEEGEPHWVLSCRKCNSDRNNLEISNTPKEILRKKSERK